MSLIRLRLQWTAAAGSHRSLTMLETALLPSSSSDRGRGPLSSTYYPGLFFVSFDIFSFYFIFVFLDLVGLLVSKPPSSSSPLFWISPGQIRPGCFILFFFMMMITLSHYSYHYYFFCLFFFFYTTDHPTNGYYTVRLGSDIWLFKSVYAAGLVPRVLNTPQLAHDVYLWL